MQLILWRRLLVSVLLLLFLPAALMRKHAKFCVLLLLARFCGCGLDFLRRRVASAEARERGKREGFMSQPHTRINTKVRPPSCSIKAHVECNISAQSKTFCRSEAPRMLQYDVCSESHQEFSESDIYLSCVCSSWEKHNWLLQLLRC